MQSAPCLVLCYHSTNVSGRDYASNDHVALATDLRLLAGADVDVVALEEIVRYARGDAQPARPCVALTFDDGCALDAVDFEHPEWGPQRGFLGILHDQLAIAPQRPLQATSFVIASPDARAEIDRSGFGGLDLWHDRWWRPALATGLITLGNHSWDHNHPALKSTLLDSPGRFDLPMTEAQARAEIHAASDHIAACSGQRPRHLAWPWGQSSDWLRNAFMPAAASEAGLEAAFGTRAEPLRRGASLWDLPRLVCGHDWREPDALMALLR